jgi:hypothetical protein
LKTAAATISANPERSRGRAPIQALALSRKQQLSLRLNQIIDAVLLAFSLLSAHTVQFNLSGFDRIVQTAPFDAFLWLMVPISTCGPLLLDLHGLYNFRPQKNALQSLGEISQALLWLGVLTAGCSIFFRLDINSRSVLVLFVIISALTLMVKERSADSFRTLSLIRH